MPKAKRTTDDPLGQKLLEVLAAMDHEDDLNYLAGIFGVKVQSTYDWIKHGRMGKDRYARLVEWSKRSLHWWFDVADTERRPPWPFPTLPEDSICALERDTIIALEGGLYLQAAQMGLNLRKALAD